MSETGAAKQARFQSALDGFVARLEEDRYVLAVVLVGSLEPALMWCKDSIGLWIVEADGVTKRRKSDGDEQRIFRSFVEHGVNLHAEVIARSKFKRMVEGNSRTAFTHNFFAKRHLVYAADSSIERWFAEANTMATKDQRTEIFVIATWLCHTLRHARRLLERSDVGLARQELMWVAWALAARAIVSHGEVYEDQVIYRGLELEPDLLEVVYTRVLSGGGEESVRRGLERADLFLSETAPSDFDPLLKYLTKQRRFVPLSELSDHFAYTQLYPWHLEAACEWLVRRDHVDKLSAPYHLTKKSNVELEEPAYQASHAGADQVSDV